MGDLLKSLVSERVKLQRLARTVLKLQKDGKEDFRVMLPVVDLVCEHASLERTVLGFLKGGADGLGVLAFLVKGNNEELA